MRGVFLKKFGNNSNKYVKKHFLGTELGLRGSVLGYGGGGKNDRTGCGKAMETLQGPKMAINILKKNNKKCENARIQNFLIFPMEGSLFFRWGAPYFSGIPTPRPLLVPKGFIRQTPSQTCK